MSRFFHGGMSDSESSSSDEEELYSEEEVSEEEGSSSEEEGSAEDEADSDEDDDAEGGSRFLIGAEELDSDEDDGKRTVKSAKDKRQEEIEAMIKAIENAQKINDWVSISAGGCSPCYHSIRVYHPACLSGFWLHRWVMGWGRVRGCGGGWWWRWLVISRC